MIIPDGVNSKSYSSLNQLAQALRLRLRNQIGAGPAVQLPFSGDDSMIHSVDDMLTIPLNSSYIIWDIIWEITKLRWRASTRNVPVSS